MPRTVRPIPRSEDIDHDETDNRTHEDDELQPNDVDAQTVSVEEQFNEADLTTAQEGQALIFADEPPNLELGDAGVESTVQDADEPAPPVGDEGNFYVPITQPPDEMFRTELDDLVMSIAIDDGVAGVGQSSDPIVFVDVDSGQRLFDDPVGENTNDIDIADGIALAAMNSGAVGIDIAAEQQIWDANIGGDGEGAAITDEYGVLANDRGDVRVLELETGDLITSTEIDGGGSHGAAAKDNTAVIAGDDDVVGYEVDLDDPDISEIWRFTGEGNPRDVEIDGDVVAVADGESVFALDLSDGSEIFEFPLEGFTSHIAIDDGLILISAQDPIQDVIKAIDVESQEEVYEFQVNDEGDYVRGVALDDKEAVSHNGDEGVVGFLAQEAIEDINVSDGENWVSGV